MIVFRLHARNSSGHQELVLFKQPDGVPDVGCARNIVWWNPITDDGDALIAPTGRTILTNLNSSPEAGRVILTTHKR